MLFVLLCVVFGPLANARILLGPEYFYSREQLRNKYGDKQSVIMQNNIISTSHASLICGALLEGSLRELAFQRCMSHSDDMVSILTTAISASVLEILSLQHCSIGNDVLSRCLSGSLLSTDVSVMDLSFNELDANSCRFLSVIISRLRGLRDLILDGNAIGSDDFRSVVHSVRRHESINSLSLSSCSLNDDCLNYISFALKSNRNISSVDLSNNAFTSDGFSTFAAAIKSGAGKNLTYLDLSYNSLGDNGINTIARLFETNQLPSIRHLILKQVGASSLSIKRLFRSVENETVLEILDLSGNNVFMKPKRSKYSGGRLSKIKAKFDLKKMSPFTPQLNKVRALSDSVTKSVSAVLNKRSGKMLQIKNAESKTVKNVVSKERKAPRTSDRKSRNIHVSSLARPTVAKKKKASKDPKKSPELQKNNKLGKRVRYHPARRAEGRKNKHLDGEVGVRSEKEIASNGDDDMPKVVLEFLCRAKKLRVLGLAQVGLNNGSCQRIKALADKLKKRKGA